MNSRNNSTKNINELVKTATNKLDTTTEKVKDDLVSDFSNQLKNASARERKLMEGELLVYLEELFKELHDEWLGKKEREQLLRQYKLYVHLAKELNFKMALDQIKRHEELKDQEKIEKKKRKKKKTEKKLKRKLEEKLRKETNKKTNQVIGDENNTGNNKATQEGNWIQVNGNGNVVILWGHYREWTTNFQNVPEFQLDAPISGEKNHREKPTQEKPVEEKPTQEKPAQEKPVDEKSVEEKPTQEKPVEEKPAEEKPAEEKPAEEKPAEEKPVEEKPVEEKPVEEKPVNDYEFDLTASLSDVENIHLENARYKAEEQIKEKYRNLNKSNVVIKLAWKLTLFLWRGLTRKKLIQEEMKKAKNKPFGDDAAVNLELGKGVNRQELESFFQWEDDDSEWKNADIVFKDIPELNQLSIDFIKGKVSEGDFQTQFNTIVKNQNRQERQKNWIKNINYLGTNILEKLKFEKAQLELVNELAERLDQWADTTEVQTKIEDFLKNYQKNPDFLEKIKADLAARNITNIKGYFKLQKENRAMALKNLKMKLKLFTDKKSAYQINNSDREKWWIFKLGKKIDKLPRWAQTLGFTGTGVLVALTGGALGLWVVGTSALTTGTVAGMTGFKNFIKKWTHYTKEQNTHEKNMTRNLSNELAKIEKRKQDSLLKGVKNLYRSHRAKTQLELYNNATQDFFGTKEISKKLLDFWATLNTPSDTEKAEILSTLVDAKARLEAYYETGHNFLASEDLAHIESDMNELHMAIDMVCKKLGLKYAKIDSETAKKNLISDYKKALSTFKNERARLAGEYGVATGAISFASAWGLQAMMGTGMYSQEAVPWSTISKPNISGKEYFGLGGTELGNTDNWGGQIYDGVKNAFGKLENNATVNIHYGAGTDATQVLPWSKLLDTSAYQAKIADIIKEIDTLNLSKDQKLAFIKQLHDEPWKVEWNSKVFTSDILHGQRCAEWLLETARGLAHSGSKVVPEFSYDSAMNIAGSKIREQSERFFDINMEIVENIPGKPGSGRSWWIPISRFDNTFKKDPEKSGSWSTTSTPDNSTTPTPGDSANQWPITKEEAEKKNEEAKKKNEEAKKKNEETEKKNEEAEKKNEEAEKKNEEAEKQIELEINENDSQSVKNIKAEINNAINKLKQLEIYDNLYKSKRSKIKKEKLDTFDEIIRLNEDAITKYRQKIQDLKAKLNDQLKAEKNEVKFVKIRDLDLKEFDFENKIYLTHHTYKTSAESIIKTGLRYHGNLQWTTNLVSKDTLLEHLENAENGNNRHRDSDTVVILEFDKKEFDINPGEKSVIDRIWEKLMLDNAQNEYKLSVPPQCIKKVVSLDLKPIDYSTRRVAPIINPADADKKAGEFRDRYTAYRKLFMKDEDKDIGKLLNDLFTDVTKLGVDTKSPEEKFKVYEDAIQRLEERKKEIDKILSKRKTSS